MNLKELGIDGKIFCLSMQRNGTSSIGDFLEQFGLSRYGSPQSRQRQWSTKWFDGDFSSIINDEHFVNTDVFEDDPWWFPEFYKYVYHHVPGSKFILLDRDADSWFKSMIRHSNGYSLGSTDIHAKIYRRENDYQWLKDNISKFGMQRNQEMIIYDKSEHYKAVYNQYNQDVKNFFVDKDKNIFFHTQLNDKDLWKNLSIWLNLPVTETLDGKHAHKSKGEFTQEYLLAKR